MIKEIKVPTSVDQNVMIDFGSPAYLLQIKLPCIVGKARRKSTKNKKSNMATTIKYSDTNLVSRRF